MKMYFLQWLGSLCVYFPFFSYWQSRLSSLLSQNPVIICHTACMQPNLKSEEQIHKKNKRMENLNRGGALKHKTWLLLYMQLWNKVFWKENDMSLFHIFREWDFPQRQCLWINALLLVWLFILPPPPTPLIILTGKEEKEKLEMIKVEWCLGSENNNKSPLFFCH